MSEDCIELDLKTIPLHGVRLIEASAGTGKTYTITALVLRLLIERGLRMSEIGAVTFTTAATEELRERVAKRILRARDLIQLELQGKSALSEDGEAHSAAQSLGNLSLAARRLERAANELDQGSIFTIHGFAQRVLREHALLGGTRLEAELTVDSARIVRDAFRDFWDSRIATLPPERLRLLGDQFTAGTLERAARAALSNAELPIVELRDSELTSLMAELRESFRVLKSASSKLAQATELLLSDAIKKNLFHERTTRVSSREWAAYLEAEEPGLTLSDGALRWRATSVRNGTKTKHTPVAHEFFEHVEKHAEVLERVAQAREVALAELRRDTILFVRGRVHGELARSRTQTFDDLLLELVRALRNQERGPVLAESLRKRFPALLIDEFQDTDPIQAEIFQRIFGERNATDRVLYLIGDPKQSIYSFRGADVDAYLEARERAAKPTYTLSTSYRSGPSLVYAQNVLFESQKRPFLLQGLKYTRVASRSGRQDLLREASGQPSPGVVLLHKDNESESAERTIAKAIHALLTGGQTLDGRAVKPSDIAVLARRNAVAAAVQRELRKLGIPAVVHGDRSVFESTEASELRRILAALLEPRNTTLVRAALATRFLGVDAAGFLAFAESEGGLETWAAHFVACGQIWLTRGIALALSELDRRTGILVRALREPDGERLMTNYRHILELLHEAESSEHWGPTSLFRFLESAIANPTGHAMAPEARQLRLESDADAVTLTTIHRSKGLEYGIVFLVDPQSCGGSFRDDVYRVKLDGVSTLDVRGEQGARDLAERSDQEEGMRLLYVALTRARHQVNVLFAPVTPPDEPKGKPLKFGALASLLQGGAVGDATTLGEYLGRITRADELRQVRHLVESSDGALVLRSASEGVGRYRPERPSPGELRAREPRQLALSHQRTSSFSALTRNLSHVPLSRAAREGRDIDENDQSAELSKTSLPSGRVKLADFPRGAGPGEALHGMLERLLLLPHGPAPRDAEEVRRIMDSELDMRGLTVPDRGPLYSAIEDILATPLLPDGVSLGRLNKAQLFPEMEFSFPLGGAKSLLSPERLALAMGQSSATTDGSGGAAPYSKNYLQELRRLSFAELEGFLRGFIDLVFEHQGKFYVLDYKSNFLGENIEDYAHPNLEEVMVSHHYHLQGALYAVAVHRYLKLALGEERGREAFGGVLYVFLRGMRPDAPGHGIHATMLDGRYLERLSAALAEPGRLSPSSNEREERA